MNHNKSSGDIRPETLVERTLQTLKKEYVLVGKTHVRAWQAWLILGIVFGAIGAVVLIANRNGKFTSSDATAGFWQVSGARFLDPSGKPSYLAGINVDLDWMAAVAGNDFSSVQQWLIDAKNLGAKVIRVFPGGHWTVYLDLEQEGGIGTYNLAWFTGMDFILNFAKNNAMAVEVVLFSGSHGSYYDSTLYAGQSVSDVNFFSSPEVRTALKRRFFAMATPYKSNPAIFAWTIMNEPQFNVSVTDGSLRFPADIYADFVTDLANHLRISVGVQHLINDGASVDDIVRSGIWKDYPAFMSAIDFFVKHQYDYTPSGIAGIVAWENDLLGSRSITKPWIFEELGHKDDDGVADYSYPPTYSDAQNAAYFSDVLTKLKLGGIGTFLWNIYGPDYYAVNPRFVPQTANAVLGVFTDVPLNLSPVNNFVFPSVTTSATLSWSPVVGAVAYGVRVQDLTDVNAKDSRSTCADTSGLYFCSDNYSLVSFSIPIVAGHSYRWWIHAIESTGWWTDASGASFSVLVAGDAVSPTVFISSPLNGATVRRRSLVTISAFASDNVGVTKVEFYVNNSLVCTDTIAPYACSWRVPSKPGVAYQLQAKAYDKTGNVGSSVIITVRSL